MYNYKNSNDISDDVNNDVNNDNDDITKINNFLDSLPSEFKNKYKYRNFGMLLRSAKKAYNFNTINPFNDIYNYQKFLYIKRLIQVLKDKINKDEIYQFFKENGKEDKNYRLELSHAGLMGFKNENYNSNDKDSYKTRLLDYWRFIEIKKLVNIINHYIQILAMIQNGKSPNSLNRWIAICNNSNFNISHIDKSKMDIIEILDNLKEYWKLKDEEILNNKKSKSYISNKYSLDERQQTLLWIKNNPDEVEFLENNIKNFNGIVSYLRKENNNNDDNGNYKIKKIKKYYIYCWCINGVPYYIGESRVLIGRMYQHLFNIQNSPLHWLDFINNVKNLNISIKILDYIYTNNEQKAKN